MSVLGKETAQQVFNPPAPTPSQAAPTPAASPLAPAADAAELDELHSQADKAIPSTQSAEQLGGSSGRKRKFTLQANPSLAGMAKGVRRATWRSCCRPTSAWQAEPTLRGFQCRPGPGLGVAIRHPCCDGRLAAPNSRGLHTTARVPGHSNM